LEKWLFGKLEFRKTNFGRLDSGFWALTAPPYVTHVILYCWNILKCNIILKNEFIMKSVFRLNRSNERCSNWRF